MNLSSIIDLKEKHKKFFISHKNELVKVRIQFLKKLKKELLAKENNIYDALYNDLKKPVFESYTSEFLMVQKEIEIFIKYLKDWSAPRGSREVLLIFLQGLFTLRTIWNSSNDLSLELSFSTGYGAFNRCNCSR